MNPSWRRVMLASACLAASAAVAAQGLAQQPAASSGASQNSEAKAPPRAVARKKEDKAKLDPSAAQGEVEAGINALAQGRAEAAVTSLTSALGSGSLPQAQTARALYYRGVAYRRTAKPALAISDLTSALWIKGGLSDDQRADALQQRTAAYREVGLPDQAEPPGLRAAQAAAKPASGAFTGVAPQAPQAGSSSGGGFFSALFGGGSTASSPPAAPAPEQRPAPRQPPTSVSSTSTGSVASTVGPGEAKPPTRSVPVISSAGSSLPVGFQDYSEPVRHVEVNTQARARQTPPPATVAGAWEEPKVKAVQQARPATQVAVATPPPPPPPSPATTANTAPPQRARTAAAPVPSGSLQVQVAAVRSEQEAQGVANRLRTNYAREIGGRTPTVDQTSVGSLGTLYRVQVGPFASARDTEALCARLKGDGMDCRVIGQ